MFEYEYPRPALTVDCVVFGFEDKQLKLLLIKRGLEPYKDQWAIPGGFVNMTETLEEAAKRELLEETGVEFSYLEQLQSFSSPKRDPRERVITVAFYALVNSKAYHLKADTDASDAHWFSTDELPKLAFDHAEILEVAINRLRKKVREEPVGFELLDKKFILSDLQKLYEAILGRPLDKRNFRKKILSMDLLVDTGEMEKNVSHRPSKFYKFNKVKYQKLQKKGFYFEV